MRSGHPTLDRVCTILCSAVESPTASSREFICNVTSYVGGIGQKVGEDGCAQKVGNGGSLEQGT